MTFLLDTNLVSELRNTGDGRADPNVTAWVAARDADDLYISVITVMELEIGVQRVERRDRRQGERLRQWLDTRVMPAFDARILAVDTKTAIQCARLHVPDPRSERDALIAATAQIHNMTIATRNTADFQAMNVPLIDPWQPQGTS